MAANRFTIPQFDIDLLNWSNNVNARNDARARQRQQDWNNVYSQAAALGNTIRAENEAEKARKNAAEQAALQRSFQAQEAEKTRAFQKQQQDAQIKAQHDYNNTLKDIERQKQEQKQLEADQILYGNLLSKEKPTMGEQIQMEQLLNKHPELDQYDTGKVVPTPFANAGESIKGSRWGDVQAQRAKEADEALRFADYKSSIPSTFTGKIVKGTDKTDKQIALENAKNAGFDSQRTAQLLDYITNIEDEQSRKKKGSADVRVQYSNDKRKEALNEAEAKKKADELDGKHLTGEEWKALDASIKANLIRNSNGTVSRKIK